jgi:hypothetical protein
VPVPAPELPRIWKPWISTLRATFARNNESLALLSASEDRYRRCTPSALFGQNCRIE